MERAQSSNSQGGREQEQGEIRQRGDSNSNSRARGLINGNPSSPEPLWPTIDGSLGLSEEDSLSYARNFFRFGFFLLPLLWAVNCFLFWPVLRHSSSFPRIRRYVIGSAIGLLVFTTILSSWALTFSIGGEHLFGSTWETLVMYNVADRFGLTGVNAIKSASIEGRCFLKLSV